MAVITDPKKIELRSFEIIDKYLRNVKLPRSRKEVIRRVVHATADTNFIKELRFHPGAIKMGLAAVREGKNIVVDAGMVKAGIDKRRLSSFGGRAVCFINDRDLLRAALRLKITRAMLTMRKSIGLMDGGIVAIGNAPTALFEVCDLVKKAKACPALIVGVPVGFVGAVEAKKKLRTSGVPYITNLSERGGSSVAAAIVNALLKMA